VGSHRQQPYAHFVVTLSAATGRKIARRFRLNRRVRYDSVTPCSPAPRHGVLQPGRPHCRPIYEASPAQLGSHAFRRHLYCLLRWCAVAWQLRAVLNQSRSQPPSYADPRDTTKKLPSSS